MQVTRLLGFILIEQVLANAWLASRTASFSKHSIGSCESNATTLGSLRFETLGPWQGGGCDYGALPGWMEQHEGNWSSGEHHGELWKVIDQNCQPNNLLAPLKPNSAVPCASNQGRPRVIMIIGDSVDREAIFHLASWGQKPQPPSVVVCNGLILYQTCCGDLIGAVHIFGSSPVGPYLGQFTESYVEIVKRSIEDWRSKLKLPDPDIVVVSPIFWDIGRGYELFNQVVLERERAQRYYEITKSKLAGSSTGHDGISARFSLPTLPRSYINSWVKNVSDLVDYLKTKVFSPSRTVFGCHTNAPFLVHPNGTAIHRFLGKHSYLVQHNEALKHVAYLKDLFVVDYASMTAGFHHGAMYLEDRHHPGPEVSLEVLNIYLNIAHQLPKTPKNIRSTRRYEMTNWWLSAWRLFGR